MRDVRIEIPKNPTLFLTLAVKIAAKNTELGDASPLKALDWATMGQKISDAASYDVQATDLHRQGESFTEKRDALLPELTEFVRASRDVLVGLNHSNPRALSDFGFVVNDAVPAKKNGDATEPVPWP